VDPATLKDIPRLLGDARFARYLEHYGGETVLALRLYSWNAAVASAFWGPLGIVEVAVRNAIHWRLADRAGIDKWWLDEKIWGQLLDKQRQEVQVAIDTARRRNADPSADDIVAASNFGLWVGLLSEGKPRDPIYSYETVFWQPRLRGAFPHYRGGRRQLHGELDRIRKFRNRVAHHEPIFRSNLETMISEIINVAGYVSADAAEFISKGQQVTKVIDLKQSFIQYGETHI
jgi:hypothetical protein